MSQARPERLDLKGFGEPVDAYRFGATETQAAQTSPRLVGIGERTPKRSITLGAALLGAQPESINRTKLLALRCRGDTVCRAGAAG